MRKHLGVVLLFLAVLLMTTAGGEASSQKDQSLLGLINSYRAEHGLNPLAFNETLTGIATWKVNDMALNDCYNHTDSLGRNSSERMKALGYSPYTWRGEVLMAAAVTPQVTFDMWRLSPTHNAVMLDPLFEVIGIAHLYREGSEYGWYWAAELASLEARPTPAPTPAPTPTPMPEPIPEPIPPLDLPELPLPFPESPSRLCRNV